MDDSDLTPVAAVIPAAGQGTRLGGQTKKQFKLLAGRPLLVHTLERILKAPEIRWLIVAVPESHLDSAQELLGTVVPKAIETHFVLGGATRQQSVSNALDEVPSEARLVAIHDAARPFPDPRWISQGVALCRNYDGAVVAVPAMDTLKEVSAADDLPAGNAAGVVKATLAREIIWQAQTPQIFRTEILRKAMASAQQSGLTGTDESYLVEAIGGRVAIIKGSPQNIKITSRSDWDFTEWKLEHDQDRHRN